MRYSFMGIMAASFCATAAIIGFAAPAQVISNHNSNAPVNFSAGAIELQDRADRVILTGGVTATQAGLSLSASRLTAAYSNGGGIDVHRLDAIGGVTITKDDLRSAAIAITALVDGLWLELCLSPEAFSAAEASSIARRLLDALISKDR